MKKCFAFAPVVVLASLFVSGGICEGYEAVSFLGIHGGNKAVFFNSPLADFNVHQSITFEYRWKPAQGSQIFTASFRLSSVLNFVNLLNVPLDNNVIICIRIPAISTKEKCRAANESLDFHEPSDYSITLRNAQPVLTWNYNFITTSEVILFQVEYLKSNQEWAFVSGCKKVNIYDMKCDLFWMRYAPNDDECPVLGNANGYFVFRLRVCSVSNPTACGKWIQPTKSWSLLSCKDILEPPVFTILSVTDENALIIANTPHIVPQTNKSLNCYYNKKLKYAIEYWGKNDSRQAVQTWKSIFKETLISLPLFQIITHNTNMCVKMRIEHETESKTFSQWKESCKVVATADQAVPSKHKVVFYVIVVLSAVVGLILLGIISYILKRFYDSIYNTEIKIPKELLDIIDEMKTSSPFREIPGASTKDLSFDRISSIENIDQFVSMSISELKKPEGRFTDLDFRKDMEGDRKTQFTFSNSDIHCSSTSIDRFDNENSDHISMQLEDPLMYVFQGNSHNSTMPDDDNGKSCHITYISNGDDCFLNPEVKSLNLTSWHDSLPASRLIGLNCNADFPVDASSEETLHFHKVKGICRSLCCRQNHNSELDQKHCRLPHNCDRNLPCCPSSGTKIERTIDTSVCFETAINTEVCGVASTRMGCNLENSQSYLTDNKSEALLCHEKRLECKKCLCLHTPQYLTDGCIEKDNDAVASLTAICDDSAQKTKVLIREVDTSLLQNTDSTILKKRNENLDINNGTTKMINLTKQRSLVKPLSYYDKHLVQQRVSGSKNINGTSKGLSLQSPLSNELNTTILTHQLPEYSKWSLFQREKMSKRHRKRTYSAQSALLPLDGELNELQTAFDSEFLLHPLLPKGSSIPKPVSHLSKPIHCPYCLHRSRPTYSTNRIRLDSIDSGFPIDHLSCSDESICNHITINDSVNDGTLLLNSFKLSSNRDNTTNAIPDPIPTISHIQSRTADGYPNSLLDGRNSFEPVHNGEDTMDESSLSSYLKLVSLSKLENNLLSPDILERHEREKILLNYATLANFEYIPVDRL